MTEKLIERFALLVISRMLEMITSGGLKIEWMDWEHNSVLFKLDPANEKVMEVLKAAGQPGGAS